MHRFKTLGIIAALTLASCAPTTFPFVQNAPMTWGDLKKRPRPNPDKTFRYGPDPYQVVDLWRPPGPGPHPVVLMVHGGCWTTSIADRTIMNWAAADLRARGIAVWNIDYRGFDRTGDARAMLEDVDAAADLLMRNAAEHRLDALRIVAVGHSAGGHLALWLGGRRSLGGEKPLPLHHVVSLGGLPDIEQAATPPGSGCGPEVARKLLASLPADKISIPRLLPLGVLQTLVNGDADRIIPTNYAHDYALKARATGDRVTVRILPNQGHVELIAPGTSAWAAAVDAIERALGRK